MKNSFSSAILNRPALLRRPINYRLFSTTKHNENTSLSNQGSFGGIDCFLLTVN